MLCSDGKKSSNLQKNLIVSVKRKSSTSPSVLQQSPVTKKKTAHVDQQYPSQVKSSYNLRNNHSSKSMPSDVVKKLNSSPKKPKDQKRSCRRKSAGRCSFCGHFLPADSSSCACFSCEFKHSEPIAYNSSRRSSGLRLTAAKNLSGEPKVIAVVPSIEKNDISLMNGRQRRVARPNKSSQSMNGESSVLLMLTASKLVSDEVKSVKENMQSESTGIVKQKPVNSSPVRCSKRVKYLGAERGNVISKASNESVWNSKEIAEIPSKSVSNPKEMAETSNEIALNTKEASIEPKLAKRAVVTRSKRLGTVFKDSPFQSAETISKKRRNANEEVPSSSSHSKEVESASQKQAMKSSALTCVKRKQKTYYCDQCEKSFSNRQRFRFHHRKCKLRLPKAKSTVSADGDIASIVSNCSGTGKEGSFEVDPEHLVLKGSNNLEENSANRTSFDNGDISEITEHPDVLSRKVIPFNSCSKISSEYADPLSTQGTFCENNSTFDEVLTNVELLCLPNAERSLDATERYSEETPLCLDTLKTSLGAKKSLLHIKESYLDTKEQCSHTKVPCLDGTELSLDATETSLDAMEPSLDAMEPSLDAMEPSLDAIEPSLDAMEPNLDAMEPSLDAMEPSLDAMEPSLDAMEPSLDAIEPSLDATETSSCATVPSLDAMESSLDAPETSLDTTIPSLDFTIPSLDAALPSLDAVEPSLDSSEPCLHLEESYLNTKVSNLDGTDHYLDTKDHCLDIIDKKVIEPCSAEAETPLDVAEPSLEITVSCLNKLEPSLNVNEDHIDVIESFVATEKTDLKGTELYKDSIAPLESKAVNRTKKQQGLETCSQGQSIYLEKKGEACFEEPHPSVERLEPSLKVPEFSLQFPESFLIGTDSCLTEIECNLKNNESNPEGFISSHSDPKSDLGESNESLKKAESRFLKRKTFSEVDSATAVHVLDEEKPDLEEAGTSVGINSDSGGKGSFSKETESNVGEQSCIQDPESSLVAVESTSVEKEWCTREVGNDLQGTYCHVEAAKVSSKGQRSGLVQTKSFNEEVQITFCPQITSVFSVTGDSKLETEPKEEISPCHVSESSNNGYNADSRDLCGTKEELKAESSEFNNMASSVNGSRNTLSAETLSKEASPNAKNRGLTKGKRKPEDSVKGKGPLSSQNRSFNKLNCKELSSVCRSCGESSGTETVCKRCHDKQNLLFGLIREFSQGTFNYHLTNFLNRNERISHNNLKQIHPLFKDLPTNFLDCSDSIACQKTQTLADGCQLETFDSTHTDDLSLVTDSAGQFPISNLLCTPPSTVSAPLSPFSCSSSSQAAEAEPIEITLTEDMFSDFDVYCKGSEDSYLCMKFKSKACLRPLKKRDIAMHFFTIHDPSELRSTFNLLHDEE